MPKIKDIPKVEKSKEIKRQCAICGAKILVQVFKNGKYSGGNYFGKIPFYTNKAQAEALKAGTTKERWGKTEITILKKDPIPYKYEEYWECNKCYKNW
jgi:hypothetical protein